MNPYRLHSYILLIIVAAIWGIAGPVIKFTLGGIDPLLFLTYRFGISTIVAIIIFFVSKAHLPKEKGTLLMLFIYGLFTSTISLGLLFFGLKNTTVLDMTLITLATPLLISISGAIFLKEHITFRERLGMVIALTGTVFTVLEPLIKNGNDLIRLSGNIILLFTLVTTIVPAILVKKLLRAGVTPMVLTNVAFIIGFITLLPFALITNHPSLTSIPYQYHLGVIYMALISGTLAYYLNNKAQKSIEVGEVAVFTYLTPIFATPLAVLWLGEKITYKFIIGAIIIAIGVAIAEIKKRRYN